MKSKKELALDYFLGKDGKERYNCAQSLLAVFDDKPHDLSSYSSAGGGSAPQGLCGAIYAAKIIAGEHSEDILKKIKNELGFLTCAELKSNKVSCLKCIEKTVEILSLEN